MVNLSIPDELVWNLMISAGKAHEKFGAYCIRILGEHGLEPGVILEQPLVKKKKPAARRKVKPVVPEPVSEPEHVEVDELEAEEPETVGDTEFDPEELENEPEETQRPVPSIEALRAAGVVKMAAELSSSKTKTKKCPYCEGPLKDWGTGTVRCAKCQRNFPTEY